MDLSQYTDAELMAIASGQQPVATPSQPTNMSGYSDEELAQLAGQAKYAQMGAPAAEDDVLGVGSSGVMMPTEAGLDAITREFAQGATFGLSDELEAALTGKTLEEIAQGRKEFKQYAPSTAIAAETMGMALSPAALLKLPKALQGMSTVGQAATKAGAGGFVYGAGTSEGDVVDRIAQGAAYAVPSALFGAGGQMLINKVGNKTLNEAMKISAENPTVKNLEKAKDVAYKVVDKNGAIFGKDSYNTIFNAANKSASDIGFIGSATDPMRSLSYPYLTKAMAVVEQHSGQALTLKQLEKIRRNLQTNASQAFKSNAKDEYGAIKNIINEIDDVVEAKLAASGDDSMKAARAAHARYAKARDLNEALLEAKTQASTTGTGGNTENLMRQAVNRIRKNERTRKYYTDAEREVMRKFSEGDLPQTVLRNIGKLSPTDSGLMTALQLGAAVVDPTYVATAAAGFGAKKLAESRMERKAAELVNKIGGVTPPAPAAASGMITNPSVIGTQGILEYLGVAP